MGCICSLPLVATLLVESAYALNIELHEGRDCLLLLQTNCYSGVCLIAIFLLASAFRSKETYYDNLVPLASCINKQLVYKM